MSKLIYSIEYPQTANPGESVRMSVHLYENASCNSDVMIYGLHAKEVWLQAPGRSGKWKIPVVVFDQGELEQQSVIIQVSGNPVSPMLEFARDPFLPLGAVFHAADLDPDHPLLGASDIYHWQIGSASFSSRVPFVAQNMEVYVDDSKAWTPILVQLTIIHPDGTSHQCKRTMIAGSAYRMVRDVLGQVQPPIQTSGRAVQTRFLSSIYAGQFNIRNPETESLRLTRKRLEWLIADEDQTIYSADESIDKVMAAHSSLEWLVEFDRSEAAEGAQGAIIHLFGVTQSGLPVHTSAVFDFLRRNRPPAKMKVPGKARKPGILDKVTHIFEQFGGDPYEIHSRTGGLIQLTENFSAEGINQQQLWRLDLIAVAEGKRAMDAKQIMSSTGKGLAGLAQALRTPHISAFEKLDESKKLMKGHSENPWLHSIISRFGLKDLLEPLTLPHMHDGQIAEGATCDMDNLPDNIPSNFACQFTGEYAEKHIPGRIANARKGDIILSPGGNGLIGGLLAQVNPPQRYAHCGIMSRNFNELSHSTASKDWLQDHANGVDIDGDGQKEPTDGFDPNALRHQWPGGIIQSAESAFSGSEFTSKEGKKYRLAAFNTTDVALINDQWQIIAPMVLKPHPSIEYDNPGLRKRLRKVADEVRKMCVTEADTAAGLQSKVHYRFYCYTDAALAIRPSATGVQGPATENAGWAAGTLPTVCSSIIWLGAQRAAEKLEGPDPITKPSDLEVDPDLLAGAQVDESTLDGLYFYTEKERSIAAEWLVDYLVDEIYKTEVKKGGWFGGALNELFSDLADDCAQQIANTFAFDWADEDAKDSDRWKNPGIGRAVSPDNLMLWDKPQFSGRGLWGYAEPLVYRQARIESVPVTTWRKIQGEGTLKGVVFFQAAPVPGAYINAGGVQRNADNQGGFTFILPEGKYIVKGDAFINESVGNASQSVEINIERNKTTTIQLDLQPPPERYRLLVVDASIHFRDDEFTLDPFDSDPDEYDFERKIWELPVQPWATHREIGYEKGWGGECRIEARLTADLNPDLSITLGLSGDLFEGTTENTTERDGRGSASWVIPKDAVNNAHTFRIKHDSEDDTYAEFQLKVSNRAQW